MPRVALAIFIVALWIYGLIDCARTPRASMPGRLPKWVWMLLALVPVLGSLLWLGLSWWAKHPEGLSGTLSLGRRSGPQASEPAPVAPDDDPEFLAKLDARNRFAEWERRKERERRGEEPEGETDSDSARANGESGDLDAELRAFLEGDVGARGRGYGPPRGGRGRRRARRPPARGPGPDGSRRAGGRERGPRHRKLRSLEWNALVERNVEPALRGSALRPLDVRTPPADG